MPDISMCANGFIGCRKRKTCYRLICYPSYLQYYADFFVKGEKCEYYIKAPRAQRSANKRLHTESPRK